MRVNSRLFNPNFLCAAFLRGAGSLLRDENGQATTEYIMILSFAVVGAAAMGRTILGVIDKGILHLGAELERTLKTGRINVRVWTN